MAHPYPKRTQLAMSRMMSLGVDGIITDESQRVLETGVKRIPELSAEDNVSAREVEMLYATIADLMYGAVRIGGMPCTGLPRRWGYG